MANEVKQIKVGTTDYDVTDPNVSLTNTTTTSTVTIHGSTLTLTLDSTNKKLTIITA